MLCPVTAVLKTEIVSPLKHLSHSFQLIFYRVSTIWKTEQIQFLVCLLLNQRVQLPNASTLRKRVEMTCGPCAHGTVITVTWLRKKCCDGSLLFGTCTTEPQPQKHQNFQTSRKGSCPSLLQKLHRISSLSRQSQDPSWMLWSDGWHRWNVHMSFPAGPSPAGWKKRRGWEESEEACRSKNKFW